MEKLPLASAVHRVQSFVRSGMTADGVLKAYDEWARDGSYDQYMAAVGSRGPVLAADMFGSLYPEDSRDISIMDVAAGSGRVGLLLAEMGFKCIDAVDASMEMLELAKLKNVYRKFICSPVGYQPLDIEEGSYDAVVCVGALGEGHLPAESLLEMVRLVRAGGRIVMVSNGDTWNSFPEYSVKMADIMEEMVTNAEISVLTKDFIDNYRMCSVGKYAKGIVIVLEKTK